MLDGPPRAPVVARGLTISLAELAFDTVGACAPDQLDLLATLTARWPDTRLPGVARRRLPGAAEPIVPCQVIYPLLTGTFAQVLGSATLLNWHRRRPRGTPPAPRLRISLDAGQIEASHAACVAYGVTLGLPRGRATLLAGALHRALLRGAADTPGSGGDNRLLAR